MQSANIWLTGNYNTDEKLIEKTKIFDSPIVCISLININLLLETTNYSLS